MKPIKAVPTNIITGALGVGKTTLIQNLLSKKPAKERWAVLVNEFGEIGIDGALLSTSRVTEAQQNTGVFVREVPGGCMCCTSGLPMQIALNQLLASARPHRLLIEPTGLGHPKEVLEALSAQHYKTVLDLRATLTLIDPRKLSSEKWREHPTFQQQMQVADCIVATKSDLCSSHDRDLLNNYLLALDIAQTQVVNAEHGEIDLNLLAPISKFSHLTDEHLNGSGSSISMVGAGISKSPFSQVLSSSNEDQSSVSADPEKVIKVSNQGEGFYSHGWVCPSSFIVPYQTIMGLLETIRVDRLKAVIATDLGVYSFNLQDRELSCSKLEYAIDSRIELITQNKMQADNAAKEIETMIMG